MSQLKNKVRWCLNKAENELKQNSKHRGLKIVGVDKGKISQHISKAEHDFNAGINFHNTGFSDWSASAFFYCIYHCLLAISMKFGYESRNQECTFAIIGSLIEDEKINFDKSLLDKIFSLEKQNIEESTSIEMREEYQYGTKLSLEDKIYEELRRMSVEVLSKTKEIIEGVK